MQKNILLTGGNGFIGSHTIIEILKNNKIKHISTIVPYNKKDEYKKKHSMETFPQIFIKNAGKKKQKIGGSSDLENYINLINNIKKSKMNINIVYLLSKEF